MLIGNLWTVFPSLVIVSMWVFVFTTYSRSLPIVNVAEYPPDRAVADRHPGQLGADPDRRTGLPVRLWPECDLRRALPAPDAALRRAALHEQAALDVGAVLPGIAVPNVTTIGIATPYLAVLLTLTDV